MITTRAIGGVTLLPLHSRKEGKEKLNWTSTLQCHLTRLCRPSNVKSPVKCLVRGKRASFLWVLLSACGC
ncbi:hypothetical protein GJAV_G00025870 [Gymnothorax javanicus]|nr:hypothetical protein GJAV_G00025870 [Gymnothorax javanicus]